MIYERVNVELGRDFFDTEEAWQQYIKEARKCKQCEALAEALEECFTVLEYVQDGHPEADKFVKDMIDATYSTLAKYRR